MLKHAMAISLSLSSILSFAQITVIDPGTRAVVIKKDQKIFRDRGDWVVDKVLAVTTQDDTVEVVAADQALFEFKNDSTTAWAITNQIDFTNGIILTQPRYEFSFPYTEHAGRSIQVYNDSITTASKVFEISKGAKFEVTGKTNNFFSISQKGKSGYISLSSLIPYMEHPFYKISTAQHGSTSSPSSSGHSYSAPRTVQTGPRGGRYYINKNGKKTYLKK